MAAHFDTVIVGAGLSGLAAGIRLAHFGERVCILERHTVPGGLNSFYRRDGVLLDAGLHAVTNAGNDGRGLFYTLLRQLRIGSRSLQLCPQTETLVRFPAAELRFSNRLEDVQAAVKHRWPSDAPALEELIGQARGFDPFAQPGTFVSARDRLHDLFAERQLAELLLCPVMSYGCPREYDMDYGHFLVLFDGIFLQGLCRPAGGMAPLVKALVRRFRDGGGCLCLGSGVAAVKPSPGSPPILLLDDGRRMSAGRVISSAGYPETLALCGHATGSPAPGEMSVIESMFILDRHPREMGLDASILFFNDSAEFRYAKPSGLYDTGAGVICAPANFVGNGGERSRFTVRLTRLANSRRWLEMDSRSYAAAKERTVREQLTALERFMPGLRPHVRGQDTFTPRTIERFTGHFNGALYGVPDKQRSAETPCDNVFVCGADQGFPGIVGALLSGVTVANRFLHVRHR